MALHSPLPAPERILVCGPAGSGKTTSWLNIAKISALTKSDATFYVGDTDNSVPRMLHHYGDAVAGNISYHSLYEWPDFLAFRDLVLTTARPQDWCVIDFAGTAWSAVQSYFVEQVFQGKSMGEYFLQARKTLAGNAKSLEALDGWKDWSVINSLYTDWAVPLLVRSKCHLLATAKVDTLSQKAGGEDAITRQMFLPYGVKPVGQKDLPHMVHTVLLHGHLALPNRPDSYTFTSVKDRERELLQGQQVTNFAHDYLVKVGGWKL
jgi:hypothetical protein